MTDEEVREFWRLVAYLRNPFGGDQRKGQAHMNALRWVAPELYNEASGSLTLDCFYDDNKVTALLRWLGL